MGCSIRELLYSGAVCKYVWVKVEFPRNEPLIQLQAN